MALDTISDRKQYVNNTCKELNIPASFTDSQIEYLVLLCKKIWEYKHLEDVFTKPIERYIAKHNLVSGQPHHLMCMFVLHYVSFTDKDVDELKADIEYLFHKIEMY